MSKLTQAVQEFFATMKWRWQEIGPTHYEVIVSGRVAGWVWLAHWEEDDSFFVGYSTIPMIVPPKQRKAAAEYLTRANNNLRHGNFEMDYSTGRVWFKTSMIMEGVEPTPKLIEQLAFTNFTNLELYLPGLMSVIYGGKRPRDVIRRIEQADRKRQRSKPDSPGPGEGGENAVSSERILDPVAERNRRVAQLARYLKLMQERRKAQDDGSCFLICNVGDETGEAASDGDPLTLQFCFKDKWFAVDIPSTCVQPADARKILRRRGFYREADRPDVGLSNKQQIAEFDPIGKKYIYGDEREAAEDAAYILFDVWQLPPDKELFVSAFSSEGAKWEKNALLP